MLSCEARQQKAAEEQTVAFSMHSPGLESVKTVYHESVGQIIDEELQRFVGKSNKLLSIAIRHQLDMESSNVIKIYP